MRVRAGAADDFLRPAPQEIDLRDEAHFPDFKTGFRGFVLVEGIFDAQNHELFSVSRLEHADR